MMERVAASEQEAATGPAVLACDECGAPVDQEQRYCVVCGAHRRNVNDPAARYLSQASARARRLKTSSDTRRAAQASGSRGVLLALAIAMIPAAAAVGVIAGRSSSSGDAKLIAALKQHESQAGSTTTVHASAPSTSAPAVAASTHSTHAAHKSRAASSGPVAKHAQSGSGTHSRSHAGSRLGSHSGSHGGSDKASGASAGSGGSGAANNASPNLAAPPTKAQKQQGAKVTQKVQNSKGSSYVNGQTGLPGTVVVP